MDDKGPGTVYHRFSRLLDELDKRFPGVANPVMSDPPEPKYLAAIDRLLEKCKSYKSQEQQDFDDFLERIDRYLSEDTPSNSPGSSEPK
jgi:hypothetical protein